MPLRDFLSKSKGSKSPAPAGPAERQHPMLTAESPLTRAICKAANIPDVDALLVALAHPMSDDEIKALADRAGGHKAHHHRVQHLRKMALDKHGSIGLESKETTTLTKSEGAVSHHKLISLGHQGPGSRGGHPWWNLHRLGGSGDWDYGPRPTNHHDITAPDHPDHESHSKRVRNIERQAYVVGNASNLPSWSWKRRKRGKADQEFVKNEKPVEQLHLQRLRDAWTAASAKHHADGRDWYPTVYEICKGWSEETHKEGYQGRALSPDEIAMMIAVTSPRQSWESNVNVVHNFIFGYPLDEVGRDGKKLQTNPMPEHMNKLELIRSGDYPSLTACLSTKNSQPIDYTHDELMRESPKTYSFWRNMTNQDNDEAATADRHMFAIMGIPVDDRGDDMYGYGVRAIRQVAAEKGVDPRVVQAVTWVWYEDKVASKVKDTMSQIIKMRETDNDVYSAHLRQAQGHKATAKDPKIVAGVEFHRRKLQEETDKADRAAVRAAKSALKGGDTHTKNLVSLENARATASARSRIVARHNRLIELSAQHAADKQKLS